MQKLLDQFCFDMQELQAMPVQPDCIINNLCNLLIGSIFYFCCTGKISALCFSMAQPQLQDFVKRYTSEKYILI